MYALQIDRGLQASRYHHRHRCLDHSAESTLARSVPALPDPRLALSSEVAAFSRASVRRIPHPSGSKTVGAAAEPRLFRAPAPDAPTAFPTEFLPRTVLRQPNPLKCPP